MGIPTYVNHGAGSSAAGAGITPALPAGLAVDDILLLYLETSNQAVTIANQNGGTWTLVDEIGQGTPGVTTASRMTIFWSRYNGTQGSPTTSAPADHVGGYIAAFRGCRATSPPIDVYSLSSETNSDTSLEALGATTTEDDCLVVVAASIMDDAQNFGTPWVNASLANITERLNFGHASGDDGRLMTITGEKATAGAYGTTTNTLTANSRKTMMTVALAPLPPTAPAAPSGATALAINSSEISVNWIDNADDEDGFIIERSPDGVGSWVEVADVDEDLIVFLNVGLTPVTEYFYRIKAYNVGGVSAWSNVASATTISTAVATVTVLNCNDGMGSVQFTITDLNSDLAEIENEAQQEFSPPSVTVLLPRGYYEWEIESLEGYEMVGATSGSFQVCPLDRVVTKIVSSSSF